MKIKDTNNVDRILGIDKNDRTTNTALNQAQRESASLTNRKRGNPISYYSDIGSFNLELCSGFFTIIISLFHEAITI